MPSTTTTTTTTTTSPNRPLFSARRTPGRREGGAPLPLNSRAPLREEFSRTAKFQFRAQPKLVPSLIQKKFLGSHIASFSTPASAVDPQNPFGAPLPPRIKNIAPPHVKARSGAPPPQKGVLPDSTPPVPRQQDRDRNCIPQSVLANPPAPRPLIT